MTLNILQFSVVAGHFAGRFHF